MTKSLEERSVEKIFKKFAGQRVQLKMGTDHYLTVAPSDPVFNRLHRKLGKLGFDVYEPKDEIENDPAKEPTSKSLTVGFEHRDDGYYIDRFIRPVYTDANGGYRVGALLKNS